MFGNVDPGGFKWLGVRKSMKLDETKKYPVEYDFLAGGIKLMWEYEGEFNSIVLDKRERRALIKILEEME